MSQWLQFSHLAPVVRIVLLCIFAVLMVASMVSIGLMKWKPQSDWTELRARIRTWWVIAGLVAGSLLLSPQTAIFFFAFVSFLALKEYFSLIPTRRADRRVMFWAYASIPIQYGWIVFEQYGMFIIFIPVYLFLLLPSRMILIGETKGFLQAVATVQWGIMGTVFFLSHATYLLVLKISESSLVAPSWPNNEVSQYPGPGLLLLLLILTQSNDVSQYMWGKSFGRHKISPKVSPNKTVEGFVGGIGTTVLLAVLLGPAMTMLDLPRAAMAGLIVGITGFLGDLNISALKRDLGVKDAGAILPGHGGVLDRIDSLIFTAPVFFHFVRFCYG